MKHPLRALSRRLLGQSSGGFTCYPYREFNDRLRCIFVHVPKTAGTSLLQAMGAPTTGRLHVEWFHYQTSDPVRFAEYFKFAVVRDPLARAMSLYDYYRQGGNGQAEDAYVRQAIQSTARSFDEFVSRVLDSPRFFCWNAFKPQTAFICDRQNALRVDYVIKLEQVDVQYAELRRLLPGISATLPHANRSASESDTRDVATEATRAAIRRLYVDDYQAFYPDLMR